MRLIRRFIRPAYITSFNQFQELKTSNETLNNVLCRIDQRSSLLCVRGKSSKAVSVTADETSLGKRKIGKKIPRNERKSMVESFVNKYREMNAGKFPTVSDTNKSVGGSYYIVKDILEELKYSSKMSSSDKMDATALPNNAESKSVSQPTNDEVPAESKPISQQTNNEVSPIVQQSNGILFGDEWKTDISSSKSEGTLSTKEIVDGPISKDAQNGSISITQPTNDEGTPGLQQNSEALAIKELESGDALSKAERTLSTTPVVVDGITFSAQALDSISECPESNKEQQSSVLIEVNIETKLPVSDKSIDAETQSSQLPVSRQQQSADSDDTSERELDKVPTENAPEKKSSLWQNLKSLTSGFFDKWRR